MNRVASDVDPQHARPDANWDLEKLTEYVRGRLKSRDDMQDQLAAVGRRSSVELFRAGQALHFIREKQKATNGYVQWLKDHLIPRTTAHDAIQLYYRAKTEGEVENFSITEAKVKFGVTTEKSKKSSIFKKQKHSGEEVEADQPLEIIRADGYLLVMKKKLDEVVQWDRSDLDPDNLENLANQCIQLLKTFLVKGQTLLLGAG